MCSDSAALIVCLQQYRLKLAVDESKGGLPFTVDEWEEL